MHDFNMGGILQPGVNILHYSQIKYLGKVSIFWYFGEEFPHFYQCFKTLFQILMKNANNFVESMIYALLLGKSFSLTFGKCFLGFVKYSPLFVISQNRDKSAWFLLKTSPESSRLCGKILATLPAKIPPWLMLTSAKVEVEAELGKISNR